MNELYVHSQLILRKLQLYSNTDKINHKRYFTLRQISKFHLISDVEILRKHSVRTVAGDLPQTLRKLYVPTKFQLRKIRWISGMLCSVPHFNCIDRKKSTNMLHFSDQYSWLKLSDFRNFQNCYSLEQSCNSNSSINFSEIFCLKQ